MGSRLRVEDWPFGVLVMGWERKQPILAGLGIKLRAEGELRRVYVGRGLSGRVGDRWVGG